MADFRQNSPSIQTAVTGESYSSGGVSGVATALGAGANAFSSFVTGMDAAATREYRANAESRAQRSEQRDIATFNQNQYEFNRKEQERKMGNLLTSNEAAISHQALVNSLKSIGVDQSGNFMDLTNMSPEDATYLRGNADQVNRIRTSLLSGTTRDAFRARVQLKNLYLEALAARPDMALYIDEIHKGSTGKSLAADMQDMQDFTQSADISREQARRDFMNTEKVKRGLTGMSDDAFERYLRVQTIESDRATRASQALTIDNAAMGLTNNNARRALVSQAPAILMNAADAFGGIRAEVTQLTQGLGGTPIPLSPELEVQYTQKVNDVFNMKVATLARQFQMTPAELLQEMPQLSQFRDGLISSFSSVDSAKRYEGANNALRLAGSYGFLSTHPAAAAALGNLEILKGIPDSLVSTAGMTQVEGKTEVLLQSLLGGISASASGGALAGAGAPVSSFGVDRATAVSTAESFAGTMLGASLPNEGGTPGNPFASITLSAGRSASNIPPRLIPQRGINSSLDQRITLLNTQLDRLANASGASDPKVMEVFLKFAADPATAGTFYIDPKTLDSTKQLLYAYNGKAVRSMIHDLTNYRSLNINAAALTALTPGSTMPGGGAVMPVDWGSVSLGTGVRMRELPDGGVTFEVNPVNLTAQQRTQAASLAADYNRKYAPGIRIAVRAYAHLLQENHTDYRSALRDIVTAGTAMGTNWGGDMDPYMQGAMELQASDPGVFGNITLDALAQDLRRRNGGK